ncbi:MAG: arylsulfatase [Planctomycetota bacterium]|nr:arylsulfatase [Planctomycetota bacterium]
MKYTPTSLTLLLAACAGSPDASVTGSSALRSRQRPNVVLIYGDDVGFGDLGCYGAEKIPTPNLDRLAAEGLRFTDGHCAAATCTPSRYALLTGVHGFRSGVRVLPPNARLTIPVEAWTLPDTFRAAGYRTGIVGKWHLGLGAEGEAVDWNGAVKPGPMELGFDDSFLLPSTNDRVPCVYLEGHEVVGLDPADPLHVGKLADAPEGSTRYPNGRKTPEAMTYYPSSHGHNQSVINGIGRIGTMAGGEAALWDDETMADVFVERATRFIDEHEEEPFFLFFSSQDIHVPRTPHPRFKGKSELGYRGDAMVQLDWAAGAVMDALEDRGLAENTIVIFSSDNGPVYDDGYVDGTTVLTSKEEVDRGHDGSGPYRGGKYQVYEGGTRVPLIVRWPDGLEPGVSSALVTQVDFVASFASMLDVPLPAGEAMDSRNAMDALLGTDLVGRQHVVEEARGLALRDGPWKLVQRPKGADELYLLTDDVGEASDVAAEHPERAEAMSVQLDGIRAAGLRSLGLR